jgi:hypothetical protein
MGRNIPGDTKGHRLSEQTLAIPLGMRIHRRVEEQLSFRWERRMSELSLCFQSHALNSQSSRGGFRTVRESKDKFLP